MSALLCNKCGKENPPSSRFCQSCGDKLSPPLRSLLAPGEVLEGRYRIVQQIGQGGFGRTYLCENLTRFNEPCVLKEFAPQVQGSYALDKAKKLFEREATVLHQLTHPQIPRFRELFAPTNGAGLFLVQDYVAGQTYRYLLAQRITQGQLFTEAEVRQIVLDTLPVLEYIHNLGVIHRDIAPDNLILRASDQLPVLIDFGGVKQLAVNAEIQATGGTDLPTCLGKIGYAPHEQLQRGTAYPHSDIYALGATAIVLLTGREPTEMIDPQNLTWNWRSAVTLEPSLQAVLERMLHPNPSARFQSAAEVMAALRQQSSATPVGGTVVLGPRAQNASGSFSRSGSGPVGITPEGNEKDFWQILRRSWISLLGLSGLLLGGWGVSKLWSNSTPSTPATPTVVESSSALPSSPASSSPISPAPEAEKSPLESNRAGKPANDPSPNSSTSPNRNSDAGERRARPPKTKPVSPSSMSAASRSSTPRASVSTSAPPSISPPPGASTPVINSSQPSSPEPSGDPPTPAPSTSAPRPSASRSPVASSERPRRSARRSNSQDNRSEAESPRPQRSRTSRRSPAASPEVSTKPQRSPRPASPRPRATTNSKKNPDQEPLF
jgi:serine/threonine protein kinase, bacterial